jgi:aminopeptidase
MSDPRIQKMGNLLVNYCVAAKKGEHVAINCSPLAQPLVEAVYEEVLKVGAHPVVRMSPDSLSEIFYEHGKPHHFTSISPFTMAYAKMMDCFINIYSAENTKALSGVDSSKQVQRLKAVQPASKIMATKRWNVTLFPTNAYAQEAEMSLTEFEDFVFGATLCDQDDPIAAWKEVHKEQNKLIRKLKGADEFRIVGKDTDLTLSVKDRLFVNSDGQRNMPSGEVFCSPIESSAEGHISYDFPVCYQGREIDGIRLVFRKGKVVEASAEKNEQFLKDMLALDKGATRLGELGIGTNRGIDKFIKSILFDEKIGGTIHLALGRSPDQCNGKNKSAIHWDMIKDLRKGGSIYVDGKLFQKDGKFKV